MVESVLLIFCMIRIFISIRLNAIIENNFSNYRTVFKETNFAHQSQEGYSFENMQVVI